MRLTETGDRTTVHITETSEGRVVTTTTVHHFAECWEHNDSPAYANMICATRDLIDGKAVCDDPEHQQGALAEWLDIAEQNAAIARKG